ncbi:MAG: rhodanese-like domain-containing protein [Candidatus Hydrothermarchaeales archaeon]
MNRKIKLLLFVTFVLLSAACLGEDAKKAETTLDTKVAEATGTLNTQEITASEFMDMYVGGEDFVLIDVRTDREFKSGYIPGAVHIPYTELGQRIGELDISKDQRIVVYCEAGVRSKKGANSLLQAGYTNIVDVTDGIRGWRALGGDIIVPGADVTAPSDDGGVVLPDVLINSEQLSKGLDSYKVIFLGTSSQYSEGHIPGAIHIDPFKDISDANNPVKNTVLGESDFEALMSRVGFMPEDPVVLYDSQGDMKFAARFYWILKYYGHENASILDGGLAAWQAIGGEVSTSEPDIQETEYLAGKVYDEYLATLDYVSQKLDDPDTVLVEATTQEEYERDGHIPGAVLVEVEKTLNSDGTIKDESELLSIYASRGITRDKEVITYCHTGNRGATLWFELKYLLKYPSVRLYDGSLVEWNAMNMPLETGVPETTSPPLTAPPTTTQPPTTTPPASSQRYLEVEPFMILEDFTGTQKATIKMWDAIKIDDAYIYITGDWNGCIGTVWWTFNIYHDTPSGGVWEGKTTFVNYDVHSGQDISDKIHEVSDALDDYTIVVSKWDETDGLTIEISR